MYPPNAKGGRWLSLRETSLGNNWGGGVAATLGQGERQERTIQSFIGLHYKLKITWHAE